MFSEIICYSLSGFFMKLSDEGMDKEKNKLFAIVTGILCAIFVLYISVKSSDAACIFLSILIGNLFAYKVDSINHIVTAILFVIFLFILGIPSFSIFCLIFCTIAAFLDEKGNDLFDEKEKIIEENKVNVTYSIKEKLNNYYFKYRFTLKVAVLILSILGLISWLYPTSILANWQFFEPMTFIYFYLFDLSYDIANLVFDRIYNFF